MKVGQFSDSFLPIVDGVGRVAYNYCDAIARKGHECCAIVPFDNMGYRGIYPFEIIDYYSKSLLIRPEYDIGIPPFDFHYKARLDQTNFDIVHVHTPFIAGAEGIKYAKEHNFDYITTTLTISPLKNSGKINEIGHSLEEKYGIKYLYSDFKKREGFKRSIVLSQEYNLYRQNYCGCKYSKKVDE